MPSRLRKKAFRSLLSLSVISPKGGELRKAVLSQGAKRLCIANKFFRTLLEAL